MYNDGCGEGNGCPTRDPLHWPAPSRQLSLCSGLFADPPLATLLRYFVVTAVSEHEAMSWKRWPFGGKNPAHNPQAFDSFLEALHGVFEGWAGKFLRNIYKP